MKLKSLFTRYRWVVFYVLLILACLAARYVIVWYKSRPLDHIGVYDLTWPDRADPNDIVYRRWRYFLKPRSYQPFKIEKYSKHDPNDSYTLEETLVIKYPTDEQIQQVIKDVGFQLRK